MTATLTPETDAPDTIGDVTAVAAALEQQRQAALDAFHRAVVATAKGQTPPNLPAIISAAGKSDAEFTKLAGTLARRLQASKASAAADARGAEVERLQAAATAARDKLEKARAEWEAREKELESKLWDAETACDLVRSNQSEARRLADEVLIATAHPAIQARLDELDQTHATLHADKNRITMAPAPSHPHDRQKRERDLARIEAELAAVTAEQQQLRAAKLDPVAGLMLGTPMPTAEEQAAQTQGRLKSLFGGRAVSTPWGLFHE